MWALTSAAAIMGLQISRPASCDSNAKYSPTHLIVGDQVKISVENEPGATYPGRDGTRGMIGNIIEDDGSDQPYLIRFASNGRGGPGFEQWYKRHWVVGHEVEASRERYRKQMIHDEENAVKQQEAKAAEERQQPLEDEKSTARIKIGQRIETLSNVVMRQEESIQSPFVEKLPEQSRMEVLKVSTNERRVQVRSALCRQCGMSTTVSSDNSEELVGWISAIASDGSHLVKVIDELED